MSPSAVAPTEPSPLTKDTPSTTTTTTPQQPTTTNPTHEEHQYLNLIRDILSNGEHRPDRTGTGTYSLFAPPQLKFSLTRPSTDPSQTTPDLILPLLTTKRTFTRAIIAELLWFVAGSTHSKSLSDAGIKIWDGNGSRAYLDSVGLTHHEEGDLGPVYGFQWRHFGAEYKGHDADYAGQGVDQLAEVVHKLKHSPYDRRIILSAWNPADLKKMALPPCHMFAQFYVSFPGARARARRGRDGDTRQQQPSSSSSTSSGEGEEDKGKGVLHSILYQRSCDMGLGVPFNIASYALLTHMLARACDLTPGTFTHTMGDAHVYLDHVEALQVQLEREPREFPSLRISREVGCDIDGWKAEDFEVVGYKPHPTIAMKMSV
ncbi:bifunctional dihydrofolate reductase-thymidylate synthase [Periconia macrospinosa]|uniref:Thymidylate synthase n=1 Tax=Periconia macrospinosa TaxID=97972 RepID=A0A2V1DEN0_9PLEO|nr:bifunctional dihydrofolate reductase-thymidylate synthase [Periconia macrospinosa]